MKAESLEEFLSLHQAEGANQEQQNKKIGQNDESNLDPKQYREWSL
jgi:hypothetical protein